MNPIKQRRGRAFTLIELLVVVAIIAVLISILLPSLNQAKKQARAVVCATNQRSIFSATTLYSTNNNGWIIRGLENIHGGFADPTCSGGKVSIYQDTPTMVLPYLGYNGARDLRPEKAASIQYNMDAKGMNSIFCYLWAIDSEFSHEGMLQACRQTKFFQCPDMPDPGESAGINPASGMGWTRLWYNYVANSYPMPYTQKNIDYEASTLEWKPDAPGAGVPTSSTDYTSASRAEDINRIGATANYIYLTEASNNIQNSCVTVWYNHIFLTSHLPFGGIPRMASDQRHPGGLVSMFFDGHAKTMPLKAIDPGYPTPVGQRLRYFTRVPFDQYN